MSGTGRELERSSSPVSLLEQEHVDQVVQIWGSAADCGSGTCRNMCIWGSDEGKENSKRGEAGKDGNVQQIKIRDLPAPVQPFTSYLQSKAQCAFHRTASAAAHTETTPAREA